MTSPTAELAANVKIGSLTPIQRKALIEMLVFGPLYRNVGKWRARVCKHQPHRCAATWISRPNRPLFLEMVITGLAGRGLVVLMEGRPGEHWAKLSGSGEFNARRALLSWAKATEALVADADLAGLVPEMSPDLATKLELLSEKEGIK